MANPEIMCRSPIRPVVTPNRHLERQNSQHHSFPVKASVISSMSVKVAKNNYSSYFICLSFKSSDLGAFESLARILL